MIQVPLRDEIPQLKPMALAQAVVDDDQLDLHFVREDIFDVDTHRLAGVQVGAAFRQPGQVGRDLNKGAVFLHAPHDAHDRFPYGKSGGVLGPGAQQLPDGEHEPPLYIPALDGAQNLLPYADPVSGGRNAADGHAINGQKGADAAAHITKRAKGFNMGHGARQDIAGRQGVEILRLAHPLGLSPGEPVERLAALIGIQRFNDKTGGAAHPCQHGNIPHRAVFRSVGTLGKGHHRFGAAQLKAELPLGIKGEGGALQNLAVGYGGPQLRGGEAVSTAVVAFGSECLHHLSFLFLLCFACGPAGGTRLVHHMRSRQQIFAFCTSLVYTISVCVGLCPAHTACTTLYKQEGYTYGHCSGRYHPHPQKAPLRRCKL